MERLRIVFWPLRWALAAAAIGMVACAPPEQPGPAPVDPGVRGGAAGSGTPLDGLTTDETKFFTDGLAQFVETEAVTGGRNIGLGPRFNSNSCGSCHSQPAIGGTSPANNPLSAIATQDGAKNALPWFIVSDGPVREARFKLGPDGANDGNVHALFVITGRSDAGGCNISQFVFTPEGDPHTGKGGNDNVIFRIPTPTFGAGLIEAIPDSAIIANAQANATDKTAMGIHGHPNAILSGNFNRSGNDGTITRFGWKAQNKSLLLFSAEAYNVEMGVTNPLFPQERDETPSCLLNPTPEDTEHFTPDPTDGAGAGLPDIERFANFMRLLAPPAPAPDTPSTVSGRAVFERVGCTHCHTPSLKTGKAINSGSATRPSAALSNRTVNLFSDLLVHHMGTGLADGITQGAAGPDEFRTAPLWGVGQRVFFLHDGRTRSLVEAIAAHRSEGSEANGVIARFQRLPLNEKQDLINFLRSL
jgi:CxxC motif-containing protein (DUF1111 family)